MAYLYTDGEGGVCIATTSYGSPDASYTFSIAQTRQALHDVGFNTRYMLLEGNCHVDDARNVIVQHFLDSECTDLVFIDADVSWRPEQVVELLEYDADIVGGVYPYRRADKQMDVPVRMIPGKTPVDGLLEVEGLPTGFMRIRRHVLEQAASQVPSYQHNGATVPIVFERAMIDGVRWGGDLSFCNRWRQSGGKVYAVYDMDLGHAAKVIYTGSLGSQLRKMARTTLRHVCGLVRAGEETADDIREARAYVSNDYGADVAGLMCAIKLARSSEGSIIEAGSGLSTILMAAATQRMVYCLEHHGVHVAMLKQMAAEAGVRNIGLCVCPIKGGWYDLSEHDDLPRTHAIGFVDGPPRIVGNRERFFHAFDVPTVLCDDADEEYRGRLSKFGQVSVVNDRLAVVKR